MDERDFLILSQLRKNPFSSYEAIGRGIGLSGNAAKARIESMEEAKILTSLRAVPAAQVFRRLPTLFFFKQPATFEKLAEAAELEPVVFATIDVDRNAGVLAYREPSAPAVPHGLTSVLGPVDAQVTPLYPHPRKELAQPVTAAELKVLRALVEDLRVPLKDIAQSSGLSQKVAKKTRRQLLEKGLLQVQPIFQSARSNRILMYEVHVHSDDDSVLQHVRQTLPRSTFINQWDKTAVILSCWADSIDEVFETERMLRGEPGVSKVRVKFHAKTILSTERLLSWIDDEILRGRLGPQTPLTSTFRSRTFGHVISDRGGLRPD